MRDKIRNALLVIQLLAISSIVMANKSLPAGIHDPCEEVSSAPCVAVYFVIDGGTTAILELYATGWRDAERRVMQMYRRGFYRLTKWDVPGAAYRTRYLPAGRIETFVQQAELPPPVPAIAVLVVQP